MSLAHLKKYRYNIWFVYAIIINTFASYIAPLTPCKFILKERQEKRIHAAQLRASVSLNKKTTPYYIPVEMYERLEYPNKARIFRIRNLERVHDKSSFSIMVYRFTNRNGSMVQHSSPIVFSVESISRQVEIANGNVYFSTSAEQMLTRAYFELRFSRVALRTFKIASKVLILLKRKRVTQSLFSYSWFAICVLPFSVSINFCIQDGTTTKEIQ